MRRISIVLFVAGVLITVCCGCRWCGADWNVNDNRYNFVVEEK